MKQICSIMPFDFSSVFHFLEPQIYSLLKPSAEVLYRSLVSRKFVDRLKILSDICSFIKRVLFLSAT